VPFCPTCRTEYREGFTHCSDCGGALVSELPETAERDRRDQDFRPIKLAGFSIPAEAEMVREFLEKNGIPAYVRGQSDPLGVTSGAEDVAVLVDESDLDRALEIYKVFFGQVDEIDDEATGLPQED
jgi:hypothetical protein